MVMRLFAVAAIAALPVAASAQQVPPPLPREPQQPLVVTTGDGVVQATPNRAWITVTAESRAASPREAQRKNADAMKPVHDRLRAGGIPDDAIKTTVYDLQPDWDYSDNRRVLRGYVARNTIEVRIDDADRVGELLDTAVSAGATSVENIRFDLKDRERIEREALRLAVADARARAEAAAAGAGMMVDRIIRIDEQGVSSPPVPLRRETLQVGTIAAAAPPVAAGALEVRAHVTVTTLLK
jgi:uncharacterized protein YggE